MADSHDIFTDKEAFEAIVRSLLEQGRAGSFGKVHVVSVFSEEEKAALGALLPKAIAITEIAIRTRLSPDDACMPVSPGKYIMVFPGLSEIQGTIKASAIARQIKERLFGKADGNLSVSVQVLPLDRLKDSDPASMAEAMESQLDARDQQNTVALQVVFQPVWHSKSQRIIGNRAVTRRVFHGHELFDDAVQFAGEQDPLAVERNERLQQAVAAGVSHRGKVFMPQAVNDHAMTLTRDVTRSVREVAVACPGGLVVELTGGVSSATRPRLRELIAAVIAGGAEVGVRVFPEPELAKFLRDCGAVYLCFNESQAKQASFTHSALYALLAVVAHEVRGLGFITCLWNTSTGRDIKRAESLGFSLFSGPAIATNRANMMPPQVLKTEKVYL